jgi:DHA1 family tetracycline resistance protein-like MFS transporter
MGASFTTAAAYIADISPPEKRAQNFGIIGAAFGVGFIIGPLIGGLLGPYGSRVPFLVSAILTLLNWLYGWFVLPESLRPELRRPFQWARANPVGALANLRRYPVITGLVASLVLLYIAAHAVQSNWAYYTMLKFDWNERLVGLSLTVIGACVAIVQGGLVRAVVPRLGAVRSVYAGFALYGLGYLLYALATRTWMMFAFTLVYCLGGIAGPALQGIISTQVPSNEQGELQGALTSLMSLTSIAGPPLMTNVFSWFTRPGAPVYFPGAALALGAVLIGVGTVLARKSLRRTATPAPTPVEAAG